MCENRSAYSRVMDREVFVRQTDTSQASSARPEASRKVVPMHHPSPGRPRRRLASRFDAGVALWKLATSQEGDRARSQAAFLTDRSLFFCAAVSQGHSSLWGLQSPVS